MVDKNTSSCCSTKLICICLHQNFEKKMCVECIYRESNFAIALSIQCAENIFHVHSYVYDNIEKKILYRVQYIAFYTY